MRKIISVIKLAIIDSFEYRVDIFLFTLSDIARPLIFLTIWLAALASGAKTPLSKNEFIQYYLMVLLFTVFTSAWSSPFISSRIRQGRLSPFLLKPFSYILYDLSQNIGEKFLKLSYLIPVAVILSLIFHIGIPDLSFGQWGILGITLMISFLTVYLFDITLGFCAFWLQSTTSLRDLNDLIYFIFSGQLFPLVVLPKILQELAWILPYRYMLSLPIEIYQNKIGGNDLIWGLTMQLFWLGVIVSLCHLSWKFGLRRYSAVGA